MTEPTLQQKIASAKSAVLSLQEQHDAERGKYGGGATVSTNSHLKKARQELADLELIQKHHPDIPKDSDGATTPKASQFIDPTQFTTEEHMVLIWLTDNHRGQGAGGVSDGYKLSTYTAAYLLECAARAETAWHDGGYYPSNQFRHTLHGVIIKLKGGAPKEPDRNQQNEAWGTF